MNSLFSSNTVERETPRCFGLKTYNYRALLIKTFLCAVLLLFSQQLLAQTEAEDEAIFGNKATSNDRRLFDLDSPVDNKEKSENQRSSAARSDTNNQTAAKETPDGPQQRSGGGPATGNDNSSVTTSANNESGGAVKTTPSQEPPEETQVAQTPPSAPAARSEPESEQDAKQRIDDEIVVTGTRGQPRSAKDSPVPIDAINEEQLEAVPATDTNDILQSLVPSYTVEREPISDGGAIIRPAKLRGLPSDKTLVLVNSKRRHRSPLVVIGDSGSQGPDIATIPSAALKSVEVLRDGAAAQYGSDAIAGVINFILKNNSDGGSLTITGGEYKAGDGRSTTISGNKGFSLGKNGFVSVSAEYDNTNSTSRSEQYCEPYFCLDRNNPVFDPDADYVDSQTPSYLAAVANGDPTVGNDDVVQRWGQPNKEQYSVFLNSGFDLNDSASLYAFGSYTQSDTNSDFFYRYPNNGTIEDLRLEDGTIYSPLDIYPGGFNPRFSGKVYDYSAAGGIKGDLGDIVSYDLSGRYGNSEIDYTIENTINPSLGPDTPKSFHPGNLINTELEFQGDFTKQFDFGSVLDGPLLVAFGGSYLEETYEVVSGESSSYSAGPFAESDPFSFCNDDGTATADGSATIANGSSLNCSNANDPVYTTVGVGSNGFPGYSPMFSNKFKRHSYAAYIDLSADVTDKLFVEAAGRFEDYSDFGSVTVGKFAGRYRLTDSLNIRASVGTGFRAPTPGQQGTTNVSTRLPDGVPVATGLFPAASAVSQALGAQPLKPEKSVNYTFGFTGDVGNFGYTVDYYRIDLQDRLNAISTRDVSSDPDSGAAYDNYQALENAGVAGANNIGGVFYFQNAFDTITQGIDTVLTYDVLWGNNASTHLIASINYNETKFDSDPTVTFNEEDAFDFENNIPNVRGVFTVVQDLGKFELLGRANYYGSYTNSDGGDDEPLQKQQYGAEVLFDLEASYHLTDNWTAAVGGKNIFDTYPEKADLGDNCCGRIYDSNSVVSWQGAYYYAKLKLSF